jgi:hypothetical protein
VFLAKSPLCEDERVTVDEAQCFVERCARSRRKYDIGERAVRDDRLDCAAAADSASKKIEERAWHQ